MGGTRQFAYYITFRDVVDTTSGQIVGQEEVIYVPLQEDRLVPSTSTTTAPLGSPEELVYQLMTIHALLHLTRNTDANRPLNQYLLQRSATGRMVPHRFDDMIMNLSIDALINGRIAYTPVGTHSSSTLPK